MLFLAFRKKLLSKKFLGRGCLKIEKRFCPMASEQGHAFANLASQRILSEKLQFLRFSQVPAGSDCPHSGPILYEILKYCIFYSLFWGL